MKRWLVLLAVFLAACTKGERPPIVVLMSFDGLRADRVGFLGYSKPTTPHLDELAKGCAVFRNHYVDTHFTLPSHMAIFTGVPSLAHGIWLPGKRSLSHKIRTLPEAFQAKGFRTAWFVAKNDFHLTPRHGFERGFDYAFDYGLESRETATRAARWIAGQEKPTFAFVHLKVAHMPYVHDELPSELRDRFLEQADFESGLPLTKSAFVMRHIEAMRLGFRSSLEERGRKILGKRFRKYPSGGKSPNQGAHGLEFYFWSLVEPRHARTLSNLYDSSVRFGDELIGAFFDEIDRAGASDRLRVIFTSDHGEEFQEHGGFSHTSLYEEILHVPLLVCLPGVSTGVVETMTQSIDIAPTLQRLFLLDRMETRFGRDLFDKSERTLFATGYAWRGEERSLQAAFDSKWKWVREVDGSEELFDRQRDSAEKRPVKNPSEARNLRMKYQDFSRQAREFRLD